MNGRIWKGKFVVTVLPGRSNGLNLPTKSWLLLYDSAARAADIMLRTLDSRD
jgi:hypothetical protein